MPGVPFCDLNDAYGSSEWEKKQNSKYMDENNYEYKSDKQSQTTSVRDPLSDPLVNSKNFLKSEPGPPVFVAPPNVSFSPSNPGNVPKFPTFENAISCNNRNNNFQSQVNNSILYERLPDTFSEQNAQSLRSVQNLQQNYPYARNSYNGNSGNSGNPYNPYNPKYDNIGFPKPYENYRIIENFQNTKDKFMEFFKESFAVYDKTDQMLQILIVMLFVIFFIQLTDLIFN